MIHSPQPSEILDRLPPQNLDAEKGVLGSLLLDAEMCDEVTPILRAEDFYAEANQKLFGHLMAMHEEGKRIDVLLLTERFKREGDFEAIGGAAYLAELAQAVPVAAHACHYAKIVAEKAKLRRLIHTQTEGLRDAYGVTGSADELIAAAEGKMFEIGDTRQSANLINSHDLISEALQRFDDRMHHRIGLGIPSGVCQLDQMTGGLHDSELVILAARTGIGKTALALNIAEYVARAGQMPTLFVSLEMARMELAQRLLCANGQVSSSHFRAGKLYDHEMQLLVDRAEELSKMPLLVDDSPIQTITNIASQARRLKRRQGLRFVVIDYLQLITPENLRIPRQEQVATITRRLKGLARQLELPVMCLAQLNRQADDTGWPRLSQLRESGAIEQDADVVLFIRRQEADLSPGQLESEEKERGKVRGVADLILAKQRNGPTGQFRMAWLKRYARFANI